MSLLSDHMIASAILALALLVTACAGGDDVQPAAGSKQVTFKVRLDGIDSRALSDGSQATRLEAVAYDASGKAVQVRSGLMTDLQGSVTFNLVEGVTYRFAFWAQSPSATCYTLSNDYTAVAVDYSGTANDDSLDIDPGFDGDFNYAPSREDEGFDSGDNGVLPDGYTNVAVYPLRLLSPGISTAVDAVTATKTVAGTHYYNLQGAESNGPHRGFNLVVTTYTDGSTSTAKMMK